MNEKYNFFDALPDPIGNRNFIEEKNLAFARFDKVLQDAEEGIFPDTFGMDFCFAMDMANALSDDLENDSSIHTILDPYFLNRTIHPGKYIRYTASLGTTTDVYDTIAGNYLDILISDYRLSDSKGAKEILQKLFTRYYKTLAKRIRRYPKIDMKVMLEDFDDLRLTDDEFITQGMILFAAQLFNIRLDPNINIMLDFINQSQEKINESILGGINRLTDIPESVLAKAEAFCDEHESLDEEGPLEKKLFDLYSELRAMTGFSSLSDILPEDRQYERPYCDLFETAIALIKSKNLNQGYTDRELRIINVFANTVEDLLLKLRTVNMENLRLLGLSDSFGEDMKMSVSQDEKPIPETPSLVPEERKSTSDDIASLRNRIHQLEQELLHQHELYESEHDINVRLSSAQKEKEEMKAELSALRRFAYESTETDITPDLKTTREDKITAIKDKNIVIIGGFEGWHDKLKTIFPKWKYLSASVTGALDSGAVDDADYVFFFTGHISHSQYNKYLNRIRTLAIPFGFIAKVNTEDNINQIFRELKERS